MPNKTNAKTWLVMGVILGVMVATAAGEVIYVDDDASPGGNGQTWGTAYKYLQDAIADANVSGDDIWVAEGTYKPDEDEGANVDPNDRTETFQLINGVAIYGGFPSGGGSWHERDPNAHETILSGDIGAAHKKSDNSYHIITGSETDETAILDGFTITAGNANGSGPHDDGGGMYNDESNPTLINCMFSSNEADAGGGMNNRDSSPVLTNCTFSGNSARSGGGMYNHESDPTLTNCTFSGNSADDYGGGIESVSYCNLTLTNCLFIDNSADYGGGISNYLFCVPVLTNCTFSNNWANYGGGAIESDESAPTLTNCILWGDTPEEIYAYLGVMVIYSDVQGGFEGEGNIDADPLFVDADGPDDVVGTIDDNLRLSAGSPCIDAGDNTAVPGGVTTDLDGRPRFFDDAFTADTGNGTPPIVDMGAYEFSWVYIGDFAGGCDVDFKDFAVLALTWMLEEQEAGYDPNCDISLPVDGVIDEKDFKILTDNWLAGVGN